MKGTFEDRFNAKINKTDFCWLWTGTKDKKGYGHFDGNKAHRVAFFLEYKRINKDLLICHRCDNPSCVRPDHLFEGTYSDNAKDSYAKGRIVKWQPRNIEGQYKSTKT